MAGIPHQQTCGLDSGVRASWIVKAMQEPNTVKNLCIETT